ncbi:MAG TPA: hypothetical protein VJH88_02460 [Candidatus Nanoarchaeia archaeon]|nr:hypothetical protein [Candidatus Nanoarchaeia archaeon]
MRLIVILLSMLIITASCSAINLFTGAVVAECDALSQQNLRDTCYAEIGIIRQNINLCDRAENEGSKYYCYEGIAETTNSSTICTDIEDSYWRNVCFKAVGMNINDASLCAQVTNEELKNTCYLDVSLDTEDETVCAGVQNSIPLTERCYTKVAVAKKDLAICRNLPPPFAQDRCGLKVIYEIGDPSTCNFLLLGAVKELCFEKTKVIADERRAKKTNETIV